MEAWRYGVYAIAIATVGALGAMNIAGAMTWSGYWERRVMIGVAVCIDSGSVLFLLAALAFHRARSPAYVAIALLAWGFCGYTEVKGAEEWLKYNSYRLGAPARKEAESRGQAQEAMESEKAELDSVRSQMKAITASVASSNGRRRRRGREDKAGTLDRLEKREAAILERMAALRPKTAASAAPPAGNQWVGNELLLACALWLFSQISWSLASGRTDGGTDGRTLSGQPPSGGLTVIGRAVPDSGARTITDSRTDASGQFRTDGRTAGQTLPDSSGQTAGQPDSGQFRTVPDRRPDSGQRLVRKGKDTVRPPVRTAPPIKLSVVRTDDQTEDQTEDGSGQPDSGQIQTAGQPDSGRQTAPDAEEQMVIDHLKAGFSIRQVAEKTGMSKWRIEKIKRETFKNDSTKSRI